MNLTWQQVCLIYLCLLDVCCLRNVRVCAYVMCLCVDDYALPGLSLQPTKKYPAGNANQVPLGDRFGGNNVRNSTQPSNSLN